MKAHWRRWEPVYLFLVAAFFMGFSIGLFYPRVHAN